MPSHTYGIWITYTWDPHSASARLFSGRPIGHLSLLVGVTLLPVAIFQKYKVCEEVCFCLFTANLRRVRSQSYSTVQRTDFSHSSWTCLQEVWQGHHLSWLQAITERTSLCVLPTVNWTKTFCTQNTHPTLWHWLRLENTVVCGEYWILLVSSGSKWRNYVLTNSTNTCP